MGVDEMSAPLYLLEILTKTGDEVWHSMFFPL